MSLPESSWTLMSTHGYSWALMSIQKHSWEIKSTHEHSLAFMTMVPWHHERSWVLLALCSHAHECSWILTSSNEHSAHGCSWAPKSSNEHLRAFMNIHEHDYIAPVALMCTPIDMAPYSWELMSTHECSWVLMSSQEGSWVLMSDPVYSSAWSSTKPKMSTFQNGSLKYFDNILVQI